MTSPRVHQRRTVVLIAVAALAAGCTSPEGSSATTPSTGRTSATGSASTATGPGSTAAASTSSSSAPTPTGSPTSSGPSGGSEQVRCASTVAGRMSAEQRVGQLLMVALDTASPASSLDDVIAGQHVGNVVYLGGWRGSDGVSGASRHLQTQASEAATGGVGLLIAADQEGGEVQQLRGAGFSRLPTALEQGGWSPARVTARWKQWAGELDAVGVNVNLAPVADTVPAELGRANKPIGRWGRQYGSTPERVAAGVAASVVGMRQGGVEATLKHFPGLGRIRNNTDFSATGITDAVATADDPYLAPFRAGVTAGAGLVMVGSARYPRLDGSTRAMFSPTIVDGLLRGRLGWDGVVVTDDVNAQAVRDIPEGERAVLVVAAGGDIVLTGDPSDASQMSRALRAKAAADPSFAAKLERSVVRVLTLKARMGLVRCG